MVVDFDPVFFSLGPVQLRWYGLMYVIGFLIGGKILRYLIKRRFFQVQEKGADSLITHLLIGMFLGARLFYVFIYNWDYYQNHINEILFVWKGGLSFHGAVTGMVLGAWVFAKKNKIPLVQVTDSMALAGSQGLFFGRIGNFINGELYGRITESKVGMIFPLGGPNPRHPSQLYEGIMEGLVLSLILWMFFKRVKIYGLFTVIFLMGYSVFRFVIEFFRQPDSELGLYFDWMTMGQILCSFMFFVGGWALWKVKKLSFKIPPLKKIEAMI